MRRGMLISLVAVAGLLLALAPAALAADPVRDPRCADWEAGTPPPGINLDEACPPLGATEVDVDLDREPLVPYIVALIVVALVLMVFGFIAMRVMRPPARRVRPSDFWTCPSCGTANRPDRTSCFSCQATRDPG